MKGKKYNSNFVSIFIEDCVKKNITSSNEILFTAENEINEINNKIIEIDKLKKRRASLLDVVETFSKDIKQKDDKCYLDFFSIKNRDLSKIICESINSKPLNIEDLIKINKDINEINFCIKQLIQNKILYNYNNLFIKGDLFDRYYSFIIKNEYIK